jgi:hypothetical protein
VGAFPVWRPNLDELDVDSAPASAFLILNSFKIIPLQLGCRVPARVLACLLSDGPARACRIKNINMWNMPRTSGTIMINTCKAQ